MIVGALGGFASEPLRFPSRSSKGSHIKVAKFEENSHIATELRPEDC